jgi:catechol 2,3-dioxygenase-like lactoylglutathione lyase family enzyme
LYAVDQETEVAPPAGEPEEMPLPSDPKVIFLGGLFILALLATAYVASEIVLPLVFAVILNLLLQPALRILERLHVPRILAALLLIVALFGTIVGLGTAISGPAGTWVAKLPEGIPRLQERLSFMREPINTLQRFLQQVEDFGGAGPSPDAAAPARGLALFPANRAGIQHINHQVATGDDVMRSFNFLSERQVTMVFGPGRHPTSSARFLYFEGPDGMVFEYSSGVREIADELLYRERRFPFESKGFCEWGAKPQIKEFRN